MKRLLLALLARDESVFLRRLFFLLSGRVLGKGVVVKIFYLDVLLCRRLNGKEQRQKYKEIPAHHPLILSLIPWLEPVPIKTG